MRKTILSAGLALMGLMILPHLSASAAELEKVRVSIIPINDVAPMFAAIQNGYFRELGLEIDTTPSTGGATGIPGLVGGSFDIAYGNVVSALLASQQGLDVRVIAPGTKLTDKDTDTTPVLALSDSGIKTGKDLEGKTFAVNTRNNVIWLYARTWVKATGGDPGKVTFKEVPFPQVEDALRQKRVDAAFLVAPFSIIAMQKPGISVLAHPYTELQLGVDVGQWITTGKLLAEKPETMKKFVAGLRKGAEWYNANRSSDALISIITGYSKTDASILKSIALPAAPLKSDLDQIKRTMDLMVDSKLLSKPLDLSKIIDPLAL
ncbi:ABC transporter substrate-binding protein [Bradyrhizobium tropiciagri]|uniref:ABC transporter substrate-binding protein n=1 Tax=Bradyrhizobium tropiciagri TaxID=312253 RepID=UPI001BA915EB|nr:ABC transporter substrate-binding protein [Bradyrhizobium tropiciagri]MBR0873207.1 ABC transporter substrate-binding protein [Bradyrhizobium tropiciagri]